MRWLYTISCDSLMFMYVYRSGNHLPNSSRFPWSPGSLAKNMQYYISCSLAFVFDSDVLARFTWTRYHCAQRIIWGVYLIEFLYILLLICHCEKLIQIEFLSPQIEVDHFQILGIILSWTVFWVHFDVIWIHLNQIGWMIHLCWLYYHWLCLVGSICQCTFLSEFICVGVLVKSSKKYIHIVAWFMWKHISGK